MRLSLIKAVAWPRTATGRKDTNGPIPSPEEGHEPPRPTTRGRAPPRPTPVREAPLRPTLRVRARARPRPTLRERIRLYSSQGCGALRVLRNDRSCRGSNLRSEASKDVPRHNFWRGQAITASPSHPPHWMSSRKTHRGLTAPVLSRCTSPTKHAGEPVPPSLLRCPSHVAPGSGVGTPHHHLHDQWVPHAGRRKSGIPATFLSRARIRPLPLGI
jgi:hypothetical protein